MRKTLTTLSLIFCAVSLVFAQASIDNAERFCSDSLARFVKNGHITVNWVDNGSRWFWYRYETGNGYDYYIVDTRNWKKSLLFDTQDLVAKINSLLPDNGRIDEINPYDIRFNPKDMNELDFTVRGGQYRYNRRSGSLTAVEKTEKPGRRPTRSDYRRSYSADSLYWFSASGDNLVLYRAEGRDSTILSSDGEHFYSFSSNGYTEKGSKGISSARGLWIGRSHKFFTIREDKRRVGTLSLVNSLAEPRPTVKTYKYVMPGDKEVVKYEAFIADADKGTLHRLDIDRYDDQQIHLPRFNRFFHTDESLWFIRTNRTRDTLDLCRVDTADMKVKTVISEVCRPHFNEQIFNYHIINDGREIIWWSERSGKGAYYLYDRDGNLKNLIAGEDFVAGQTIRIDTLGRNLIFEGYGCEEGVNPHYKFYYRASLDGRGKCTLLTPGNGEHQISFSPDGNYVFDTWSRMDYAPHHQICDMKGRVRMELGAADFSELYRRGWREPEVVEFMAADSVTKLYGVVYLPFNIEEGRKYPVISNVYPGPQTDLVPQGFFLDDNCNQCLAQLGYIVINVSYRGSCPIRGRDFYNHGYGNLRDYPLDDDYAVIQQVGKRYPFADLDRVGIYGHSGGAFMTVAAMLTRPDFYKVGVAASGNHDNNIYMQAWGETFHGVSRTPEGFECEIPTNIELAANLKGKLLLITGDMDNNVHPANTYRLAEALIKNNKRFDMMVLPGADHGLGDQYYINLIRYHFIENL